MEYFAQSTPAPKPKTTNSRMVGIFYAVLLIVMVVAQLFKYEQFAGVLADLGLPGGDLVATLSAAIIVTLEVAALPFLLSMRLSWAARWVSMVAGWLAAAVWLKLAAWTLIMVGVVKNSALLGATVSVPGGLWLVFFSLGLCTLAAWASWGMWPGRRG